MKEITHRMKGNLLLWLLLLVPLVGFTPAVMAQEGISEEQPNMLQYAHADADGNKSDADGNKSDADGNKSDADGNKSTEPPAEPEQSQLEKYQEIVKAEGDDAEAFPFFTTSMLWTVMAAALVFIMHLGFSTLEVGLTRSKNTVNILFKNLFIISIGLITYALFGFNTHYPGDLIADGGTFNGWFGWGSMIGDLNAKGGSTFSYGGLDLCMTGFGDFIFQAMFAATAATIVSGAVAERVKLSSFLIFATLLVGVAYPVVGSWHWGGGVLAGIDFKDFAGSAVVHAFGGFAALGCVLILGPRKGKYDKDGKVKPIPGHNLPLATIGVLLLWFGWYGFNGGSVLSANPGPLGLVFTTTSLAAAAGAISASLISWLVFSKPDLSMGLNGALAGLVGITANADIVLPGSSIIIGLVAGVIVVFSVIGLDKVGIDDPVGAISVHGTCGIWGILAAYFFQIEGSGVILASQIKGIALVGGVAFVFSIVVFGAIKAIMGVRVSEEEEDVGLDISEHGQESYPEFTSSVDR